MKMPDHKPLFLWYVSHHGVHGIQICSAFFFRKFTFICLSVQKSIYTTLTVKQFFIIITITNII